MVKKGEVGVPRSPETRAKIGKASRERLTVIYECSYGCTGKFNHGNLAAHTAKYHTFVCKIAGCTYTIHDGLGYCNNHYRLHAFCLKVGVTIDTYYELYAAQGGKCAICPRQGTMQGTEGTKRTDVLVVDHCHTSGQFRGLICYRCNLGLGHFQDDVESLKRAIAYLEGTL